MQRRFHEDHLSNDLLIHCRLH
ncbi:hypothetical protein CY0110_18332 [Crocosphaera chwakensis CCY0110]|uniref:Uncharacterized protein n=1 Tax=Crocosphaera chwakensis CCY0110 TaxID=391612 RepID=A3IIZ8_9CHRO|nr:hypothetical protein CY0110_18332 [Crocosphaera chwakensis CCY0110]